MSCFDSHHYIDPLSPSDRTCNFFEAMAESILDLSDDDLIAELKEDGEDLEALVAEMGLAFENALRKAAS